MKVHCKYDALVPVGSLKPFPKNRNSHSEEQIERLALILEYQGIRAPIIVDADDRATICKGHGTLAAIRHNNWQTAPVVYQHFENDDQRYTFVQSDNAIAAWSEIDLAGINADLPDLGPLDLDLLGLKSFSMNASDKKKKGQRECPHCGEEF